MSDAWNGRAAELFSTSSTGSSSETTAAGNEHATERYWLGCTGTSSTGHVVFCMPPLLARALVMSQGFENCALISDNDSVCTAQPLSLAWVLGTAPSLLASPLGLAHFFFAFKVFFHCCCKHAPLLTVMHMQYSNAFHYDEVLCADYAIVQYCKTAHAVPHPSSPVS